MIRLEIAGVDRTDWWLRSGGLRIEDVLNGRSRMTMKLVTNIVGEWPEDGQRVFLTEDGFRRFGGFLHEPQEYVEPGTGKVFFDCSVVDFSSIFDRVVIAAVYTNMTVGAIVRAIIEEFLPEEGIDILGIEEGPIVEKAVFPDMVGTSVLNELCELSGMHWLIDPYLVFRLRAMTSLFSGVTITNDIALRGTVRIKPDKSLYRNVQILKGPRALTLPREEFFVGDGERRTFNVSFPVGTKPEIFINDVENTSVGIRQIEEGRAWEWSKGSEEISQTSTVGVEAPVAQDPLTTEQTLKVVYRGLFPVKIEAALEQEIARRKEIEGGGGRYMRVEERSNIDNEQQAMDVTQAFLARHGKINKTLTLQTRTPEFAPGQICHTLLEEEEFFDDVLLTQVTGTVPPDLDEFWYALTGTTGDSVRIWQDYFRRQMLIGRQLVIRENEVVVVVKAQEDGTYATDTLTVDVGFPENRIGQGRVGFMVVR
jgi:hypothetical protein